MPEKIRRLCRSGQARIEYRAVQQEVNEKLAAGYSKIMIFEELAASGKLTVSYSAFCDYVRGSGVRLHSHRRKAKQIGHNRSGSGNLLKRDEAPRPFTIDRNVTLEDLVGPPPKD